MADNPNDEVKQELAVAIAALTKIGSEDANFFAAQLKSVSKFFLE